MQTLKRLLAAILAVAVMASMIDAAEADEYRAGPLIITRPWARATPSGAHVGGAYMVITNRGSEPDRLLGGSTPVAGGVEVHEMRLDGDVMRMRALADGLEIGPGAAVEIKPGGYHVMFTRLKAPLRQDERVPLTLEFARSGKVNVELAVQGIGATSPTEHGGHDHSHGSKTQ